MKTEAIFAIILLCIAVFAMGGCSTVSEWVATEPEAVEFVVKRGTRHIIDGDEETRARVIEVTEHMRQYVDGNPEALASEIVDEFRRVAGVGDLEGDKRKIADRLFDELEDRIAHARQGRMVEDDEKIPVLQVLDWVEQAAYE